MADNKKNRFTKISQIGFIVKDLEKVKAGMRKVFGVEPDGTGALRNPDSNYRGLPNECASDILFYDFANIQLEFIKPLEGKSAWQDFLDKGGEGLHHINFLVDDLAGTVQDMTERGFPPYFDGASILYKNARWMYFETDEDIPFIIEVNNKEEFE